MNLMNISYLISLQLLIKKEPKFALSSHILNSISLLQLLTFDDQADSNELSVVVLTSHHISSYHCFGEQPSFDAPIQRCLVSPSSKKYLNLPCKRLEQPNVIKGVPAAGMCAHLTFIDVYPRGLIPPKSPLETI